MTYAELCQALAVFGLGERASITEIKKRHRVLVKKCHPDSVDSTNPEQIRAINAAYRVLSDYIGNYRFSFCEEEFYEQNPEERLRRQFMNDPVWGKEW